MPDDNKPQPQITNRTRSDWNDYIKYLRSIGIAGDPSLDRNGVGKQYLAEYIQNNPNTSLTPDIISPIQADLLKYKDYALNQVKLGKAVFQNGVNADNFMQDLSPEDGYAGSLTTQHLYPKQYLEYLDQQSNLLTTQDKGFATAQNK